MIPGIRQSKIHIACRTDVVPADMMTEVKLRLPRVTGTPVGIRRIRVVAGSDILGDHERIRHAVHDARRSMKTLCALVAR